MWIEESIKVGIEIGTPHTEVIKLLGETQGTLSGFYGDVCKIDNSEVVVYYEVNKNNDAVVSNVKIIPLKWVYKPYTDKFGRFENEVKKEN